MIEIPYIKTNRRSELEIIVRLIGELDILGNEITSIEKTREVVRLMLDLKVEVNGDFNYILYTVCKRYVKPSYNNYKKYLTKFYLINFNISPIGDLSEILYGFYFGITNNQSDKIKNERNNNIIGELDCCAKEIYRRLIAPYENEAIEKNGDIV